MYNNTEGKKMDYFDWFANRISALRLKKGVSAREMSLALGQSESYINKIENRRTMPSMSGFLYICEYLDVLPGDFFNERRPEPHISQELLTEIEKLSPRQAEHLLAIVRDIVEK